MKETQINHPESFQARNLTGLAAALTLGLFAIPGVSRADADSSPRLKLVVVKTLPYPVINSKTPGAEKIPGGFEGGNTVKVTIRGKSEYHLFAHSYETLDWSHCRLDHWISSDGLHWRHDQVLVPPYTDKATKLWTLSCSANAVLRYGSGSVADLLCVVRQAAAELELRRCLALRILKG